MSEANKPLLLPALVVAALAVPFAVPYSLHSSRAAAGTALRTDVAALTWRPLLVTGAEQGLAAPPAPWSPAFHAELWKVSQARFRLTPEQAKIVQAWTSRPTVLSWNDYLRGRLSFWRHKMYPPRNARAYALVNVAIYDAMLAAHRARATFGRPSPARVAPWSVPPAVPEDGQPVYPAMQVAGAWAAATVIGHLLPEEREGAMQRAQEATDVRLWAGLNYPSDLEAAKALGIKVAEAAIASRKDDGAEATSGIPALAAQPLPKERHGGLWTHPVPTEPRAASWKPWLLERPDQFQLPEPPRPGSPAFEKELDEVLAVDRQLTDVQKEIADRWAMTAPSSDWNRILVEKLQAKGYGELQAARVLAYWGRSQADAAIACWQSKYHWMQIRPQPAVQRRDPKSKWWPYLVTTPAHPSYPSGHSAFSAAAAAFVSGIFPEEAESTHQLVEDISMSRLWGGIHFRSDLHGGHVIGERVGKLHLDAYRAELGR